MNITKIIGVFKKSCKNTPPKKPPLSRQVPKRKTHPYIVHLRKREKRGKYRITLDQNEMDFLDPSGGYTDSLKAARSIKRRKSQKYSTLSYSIEERGSDGFWRKVG